MKLKLKLKFEGVLYDQETNQIAWNLLLKIWVDFGITMHARPHLNKKNNLYFLLLMDLYFPVKNQNEPPASSGNVDYWSKKLVTWFTKKISVAKEINLIHSAQFGTQLGTIEPFFCISSKFWHVYAWLTIPN